MKGVIVAAGYGTRFLPVTRTLPKEMLPLLTRPSLDFIVAELVEAGITDILVISSRRKRVLEDWFDWDKELQSVFEREGAEHKLAKLAPPAANVHFVRQHEMKGTGHAIALARSFVGDDAFVVAYPDDLFGQPNCTAQLIETHRATGRGVLAAHDLSGSDVSRYGVLDVATDEGGLRLERIVEKPPAGTEPSHLVSLGRYLFTPTLFDELERGLRLHEGGEYYHIDAINHLAALGEIGVRVVDAERWDTGAPLGYAKAFIQVALDDPDVGEALAAWLKSRL